jgi:hypothetical protein
VQGPTKASGGGQRKEERPREEVGVERIRRRGGKKKRRGEKEKGKEKKRRGEKKERRKK